MTSKTKKENLPTAKDSPYISLQRKIWFSFLFIYTPISLLTFFGYYSYTLQSSLNLLTRDLSQTIDGIVKSIDAENFRLLYQEESANNLNCPPEQGSAINGYYPVDNPRFRAHMDWLQTVLYYHPNAYVYTYVKGPTPGDVIGISSSGFFRKPQAGFKFCELYNSHGRTRISEGLSQRTDVWEIYEDAYGSWITSYAPIKDANGQIVGAVGVDIPANVIVKLRWDLQVVTMLSFGFIYFFIFILILRFTNTVIRPIQKLALITGQIGGHKPDMKFSEVRKRSVYQDDLDTLIESMQAMVTRIEKQNLELTQSREQMQNLTRITLRTQEEERRFVSRELHDQAGHMLLNLRYAIEAIMQDLKSDDSTQAASTPGHEAALARLSAVIKQIDQTMEMTRALSHQIRTSLLDVGDISLALQELCADFKKDKKIKIIFEGALPSNPSDEIGVSLYRFLQEALTNVLKHASATEVRVSLQAESGWITLSVADNGQGVAAGFGKDGIGILGMKERLLLLGGTVEAKSNQNGFFVTARVPMGE